MNRFTPLFLTTAMGLAACGGGGGGVGDAVPPPPVLPPSNTAPVASVSASATSDNEGRTITLDASASSDADGDALTFSWSQTGGSAAAIVSPDDAITDVVLPEVDMDEVLTFEVRVSDGTDSDAASVDIDVINYAPSPVVSGNFKSTTTFAAPETPADLAIGPLRGFEPSTFMSSRSFYLLSLDETSNTTSLSEFYIDSTDTPRIEETASNLPAFPADAKLGLNRDNFIASVFSEAENRVDFFVLLGVDDDVDNATVSVDVDSPCAVTQLFENDLFSDGFIATFLVGTPTALYRAVTRFGTVSNDGQSLEPRQPEAFVELVTDQGSYCELPRAFSRLPPDNSGAPFIIFDTDSFELVTLSATPNPQGPQFGEDVSIFSRLPLDVGELEDLQFVASDLGFSRFQVTDLGTDGIDPNVDDYASLRILANDGELDGRHVLANLRFDIVDNQLVGPRIIQSREWNEGLATGLGQSYGFGTSDSAYVVADPTLPFLRLFPHNTVHPFDPEPVRRAGISFDGDAVFFPTSLGVDVIESDFREVDEGELTLTFPETSEIQTFISDNPEFP